MKSASSKFEQEGTLPTTVIVPWHKFDDPEESPQWEKLK